MGFTFPTFSFITDYLSIFLEGVGYIQNQEYHFNLQVDGIFLPGLDLPLASLFIHLI